jgi:hypothetical protein
VASGANVCLVGGSAKHRPVEETPPELRRNSHAALLVDDGVAHKDLCTRHVLDEDETVAAIEQVVVDVVTAASKAEALRRNAVGSIQEGGEHDLIISAHEGAEKGRLLLWWARN